MDAYFNYSYPGPHFQMNVVITQEAVSKAGGEENEDVLIFMNEWEKLVEKPEINKIYVFKGDPYIMADGSYSKHTNVAWIYNHHTQQWDGYKIEQAHRIGCHHYDLMFPHIFSASKPHKPEWPDPEEEEEEENCGDEY